MSSLWPEACSNFGLISAQTAVIAPPARTLISAARAFGSEGVTNTDASNARSVNLDHFMMCPSSDRLSIAAHCIVGNGRRACLTCWPLGDVREAEPEVL